MNLKQLFEQFRGESRIKELARDLAERCRHDVWDKVWHRAVAMELAEARGYVRSRAAIVVSREVDWVAVDSRWLNSSRRQRLFDQTLALVTQLIVAESRAAHVAPARRAA